MYSFFKLTACSCVCAWWLLFGGCGYSTLACSSLCAWQMLFCVCVGIFGGWGVNGKCLFSSMCIKSPPGPLICMHCNCFCLWTWMETAGSSVSAWQVFVFLSVTGSCLLFSDFTGTASSMSAYIVTYCFFCVYVICLFFFQGVLVNACVCV